MRRLILIALAATFCILLASAAQAQRLDGTLRVTVTDKSQASIEDAKVIAQNEATGVAAITSASPSPAPAGWRVGQTPLSVRSSNWDRASDFDHRPIFPAFGYVVSLTSRYFFPSM